MSLLFISLLFSIVTSNNVLYNIAIIYYQKDNYKLAIKNLIKSL